ncbi:MAG: BON domain-containing protein [Betaproteobacteria bacterium]|nr:BON domain-containing protein [Betaproteobacteria bacterium]
MDEKFRLGWIPAGVFVLLVAACNSDWSDRVPEVNAQAGRETEASAGQTATPGNIPTRPTESIEDAALSSKIEAALEAEPDLHGSAIAVRSQEGVVTLSGTTPDPKLRSMAAQVALSIDGVKLVRNEIALAQEA